MDTQTPIPANAVRHGSCGQWWTGAERSHCGGCHITLSSLTAFERHRRGMRCNPPETVGLVARQKPYGVLWGLPAPEGGYAALHAPAVTETVHGCPPDGSGLTPCCGRTPFELPLSDRISSEAPATCTGTATQGRTA